MPAEFDLIQDLYWQSCPACTQPRAFERPPCPDGHGRDCPELVCTACGCALLLDTPAQPVRSAGAA